MGEELKPNSHRYREKQKEREKVEQITSHKARIKKKSGWSKITDIFLPEDLGNMKEHLLDDVLVPRILSTIVDLVTDGVNLWAYGDTKRRRRKGNSTFVSYEDRFSNDGYEKRSDRKRHMSIENIILDDRGEAEAVLDRLDEMIATYGFASVSDLYDLVGVTGEYTDCKYGWYNISTAKPVRVPDGYILKMPNVRVIE